MSNTQITLGLRPHILDMRRRRIQPQAHMIGRSGRHYVPHFGDVDEVQPVEPQVQPSLSARRTDPLP
jgi:hypothetical protein